ncbi:MAG: hypothetical protein IJ198_00615 [Lachnospiraceae bacterium]|nr:hypothetical protein [Lachnospiraceae bacterium]
MQKIRKVENATIGAGFLRQINRNKLFQKFFMGAEAVKNAALVQPAQKEEAKEQEQAAEEAKEQQQAAERAKEQQQTSERAKEQQQAAGSPITLLPITHKKCLKINFSTNYIRISNHNAEKLAFQETSAKINRL